MAAAVEIVAGSVPEEMMIERVRAQVEKALVPVRTLDSHEDQAFIAATTATIVNLHIVASMAKDNELSEWYDEKNRELLNSWAALPAGVVLVDAA